ncbi:hypothetical protein BgiMline_001519 [Biomphalaria glabrata]
MKEREAEDPSEGGDGVESEYGHFDPAPHPYPPVSCSLSSHPKTRHWREHYFVSSPSVGTRHRSPNDVWKLAQGRQGQLYRGEKKEKKVIQKFWNLNVKFDVPSIVLVRE